MFNHKKFRITELEHENSLLKKIQEINESEIKRLRERIKFLESGTRCDGKWCDHCDFHGGDKLAFENGVVIGARPVCLKEVPCPDFVRKGGPKPHD